MFLSASETTRLATGCEEWSDHCHATTSGPTASTWKSLRARAKPLVLAGKHPPVSGLEQVREHLLIQLRRLSACLWGMTKHFIAVVVRCSECHLSPYLPITGQEGGTEGGRMRKHDEQLQNKLQVEWKGTNQVARAGSLHQLVHITVFVVVVVYKECQRYCCLYRRAQRVTLLERTRITTLVCHRHRLPATFSSTQTGWWKNWQKPSHLKMLIIPSIIVFAEECTLLPGVNQGTNLVYV